MNLEELFWIIAFSWFTLLVGYFAGLAQADKKIKHLERIKE